MLGFRVQGHATYRACARTRALSHARQVVFNTVSFFEVGAEIKQEVAENIQVGQSGLGWAGCKGQADWAVQCLLHN